MLRSSIAGSVASSAAAELPSPSGVPTNVQQQLASGLLPLFHLLPSYYREADCADVTYLSADEARRTLLVGVDAAGRLVDATGRLLAPQRETIGMYVMDSAGAFLCSIDGATTKTVPQHRYHHSSMVAGSAVAAAGQLAVYNGRISSLSNESDTGLTHRPQL